MISFLTLFVIGITSASDPNDEFLRPQLIVVLHGQAQRVYQGSVIVNATTYDDDVDDEAEEEQQGTPEFNESIDVYDYDIIVDPKDIRISRIHWNVHKSRYPDEEFPQGNASNYETLNYLGDGTFSQVSRAKRLIEQDIVVVKVEKPKYLYYVKKELKALEFLKLAQSDNTIVQVVDAYMNDTSPVLVFAELPDCKTFDYKTYFNDFNKDEIQLYFRKLYYALAVSSRNGIMHRDIKPANIIYTEDEIQLIDWGVADFYYPLKQYRTRVGTRYYRAPEQLIHYKYYDYSVDVWAIGCIMASAVFKQDPFFKGVNNDDQLHKVVSVLGSDDFFKFCLKYGIEVPEHLLPSLSGYPKVDLRHYINEDNEDTATEEAIQLLEKILVYDHHWRLSAEEILQDNYFII